MRIRCVKKLENLYILFRLFDYIVMVILLFYRSIYAGVQDRTCTTNNTFTAVFV
jgi:hypothetical protein